MIQQQEMVFKIMKKIALIILVLCFTNCKKAHSQFNSINPPLVFGYNAETVKWLAYLKANSYTTPSLKTIGAVDQFINGCMIDGNYTSFQSFFITSQDNQTNSCISIVNPATTNTLVNSGATWMAYSGFNTNGSSTYIDTKQNPSTIGGNFTLNNASFGFYASTIALGQFNMGTRNTTGTAITTVVSANFVAGGSIMGISTPSYSYSTLGPVISSGLVHVNRTASNLSTLWLNGVSAFNDNNATNFLSTWNMYIGASNNGGSAGNYSALGNIVFLFFGGTVPYPALLNQRVQQLINTMGIAPLPNVVFEGDSWFGSYPIPAQILTQLAADTVNCYNANYAITQSSISSINNPNDFLYTSRLGAVKTAYNPNATKNVCGWFEGINELYYQLQVNSLATSVTNTYNAYLAYADSLTAKGYKVVFNTLTPRQNSGTPANYESARQNAANKNDATTINGLLRNDFTVTTTYTRVFKSSLSKWANCYLLDIGNDPNMGQAGQCTDLTYYQSDFVHPSATGQQVTAQNYYAPCINGIIKNRF